MKSSLNRHEILMKSWGRDTCTWNPTLGPKSSKSSREWPDRTTDGPDGSGESILWLVFCHFFSLFVVLLFYSFKTHLSIEAFMSGWVSQLVTKLVSQLVSKLVYDVMMLWCFGYLVIYDIYIICYIIIISSSSIIIITSLFFLSLVYTIYLLLLPLLYLSLVFITIMD